MTPAYLAALKAVATAAEERRAAAHTHRYAYNEERSETRRALESATLTLDAALATLRALPESGEVALKPGDEVEARYVKATDGTMVASFGEFIVCNRSVRADELPAILVEVAAHIPAAELRAVLARVRVP